ncbi:MAG: right-handed parallel beta-helix repeat-containing protein [Acidimicrobiia bacterium]|nr:right-handed parallel beta-helix repeat-containing protein [Acidimicrobiia bacterium]
MAAAVAGLLVGAAACGANGGSDGGSADGAIWVQPGATKGDGSEERPFGSLVQARDAARDRAENVDGDVTIHLMDGTHLLSKPLTLGPEDSGRNGHEIVWKATEGADPVVSGGITVADWTAPADGSDVWTASVPADIEARQLYVDGKRAQLAQGRPPTTLTPTAEGYTAGDTTLATWTNPEDIEFVYPSGPSNWTETRCRVAGISGTAVTMVQPCFDNSSKRADGKTLAVSGFGQSLRPPSVIANARELLTEPGQWYLDSAADRLYYSPVDGQDMATVEVVLPVLETLVQGTGTADEPLTGVRFEGITFSYAGWNEPSGPDGYSPIQAGARLTGTDAWKNQGACDGGESTCPYMAFPLTPGNVTFTYGQHISFVDNTFEHLGSAGLNLGVGIQDSTVSGNLFRDVSSSGLVVGTVDQPEATDSDLVSGIEVANNYVTGIAVEYQDAPGVVVGYTQAVTVRNNQIDDVPYSGLSIGWGGWAERFPDRDPLATNARDNQVVDNLVFDHMKVTVDGGGIYANGVQGSTLEDGLVIEGNVVLQQHDLSWAIYTDNGAMYMTVRRNAVWDAVYVPEASATFSGLSPYFSFGGCGGGPIAYKDNYSVMDDPSKGLISASSSCGGHPLDDVTVDGNTVLKDQTEIPADLVAAAGLEAEYRSRLDPTPAPNDLPPWTKLG